MKPRNLGYDPKATMSSSSPAAVAAAASDSSGGASSTTYSYSDLFPTSTNTSSSNHSDNGSHSATVYYLVFLAVLVVLMTVAACLALRAYRMRRRYRTATQIALARGEPLPARDDYWGLGGLAGWTAEGLDRLGAMGHAMRTGEDGRKKWMKPPVLYEAEVEVQEKNHDSHEEDLWHSTRPLTLHSCRPPDTDANLIIDPDAEGDTDPTEPVRNMGPRPRPPPLFNFARNRSSSPSTSTHPHPSGKERNHHAEMERELQQGEKISMAVVIQMPTLTHNRSNVNEEDEEAVAWEQGMELGVWNGVIGAGSGRNDVNHNYLGERQHVYDR